MKNKQNVSQKNKPFFLFFILTFTMSTSISSYNHTRLCHASFFSIDCVMHRQACPWQAAALADPCAHSLNACLLGGCMPVCIQWPCILVCKQIYTPQAYANIFIYIYICTCIGACIEGQKKQTCLSNIVCPIALLSKPRL